MGEILSRVYFVVMMATAGALAAGPFEGRPDQLTPMAPTFLFGSMIYPSQDTDAAGGRSMGFVKYASDVAIPVHQDEQSQWGLSCHVGVLDTDTSVAIPGTGLGVLADDAFPEALWDISAGVHGRRRLENGWILGGGLQFGSPSDRPFASADEMTLGGHVHVVMPADERSSWLVGAGVSNDYGLVPDMVLPGLAWMYYPDRDFNMVIGAPVTAVNWRFAPRWTVAASHMLLHHTHAEVDYDLVEGVMLYGAFDWDSDGWLRRDRRDDDDTLFLYEMRVSGGAVIQLGENASVEAAAGYAFDRFWFEGEDYDDRDEGRINLTDGFFAQLALKIEL